MKATDWRNYAKLIKERQSQVATADTSELSSLPLSDLSVDESGPPTVYRDHMYPYLQAHLFMCNKIISQQWIVH